MVQSARYQSRVGCCRRLHPTATASLTTGFGTGAYVTIQKNSPTPSAIGTSNHNQRQLLGADVSDEGVGPDPYIRSSPRSIEVSSIVSTTYQAGRRGTEYKVIGVAVRIGSPVMRAGSPWFATIPTNANGGLQVVMPV